MILRRRKTSIPSIEMRKRVIGILVYIFPKQPCHSSEIQVLILDAHNVTLSFILEIERRKGLIFSQPLF